VMRPWFVALLLVLASDLASAEALYMDLSTHRIEITSNFVGQDLTLFGTIVPDRGASIATGDYDIVALVRGPSRNLILRRKVPFSGVWISREVARLTGSPSSLFRLSSGPVETITTPDLLQALQLDLPSALKARSLIPEPETFAALTRLMKGQGLLRDERSIEFAAPSLFRATLPLPGSLPTGTYGVDLYLFRSQQFIGSSHSGFTVEKSGFSADLAQLSQNQPLVYGLITAFLALFFGWFASVIFRRD
jgi:uncharacterized protein (TIGR02186 family)